MSCTDKNPLTREGTSLLNRLLAALPAGYARVDEREAADILLFAKRYAACLNYYKADNTVDGNWQPLMRMDVSVTLAGLSRIDVQAITDYKKRLYKRIKLSGGDADAKEQFRFLFDLLFSLVTQADEQFSLLPADFEYTAIFRDTITGKLQRPLANLEKCFNDFKAAGLLDYTAPDLDSDAPIDITPDENFNRAALGPEWQAALPDIALTLPAAATARDTIIYIIHHNLFNAQVELLFNGISTVVSRTADLFTLTLGDYPKHSPHFALFLAFLKVFRHAQDELNHYTQRHLDFYYKGVLQLINKAPEPDSAHLVLELQKTVDQHRLLKNTLFKGGKDSNGREINYALADEVVLNKATVSALRSWQLVKGAKDLLKASPVANSDDGQGAKLSSADNSWFAFGDSNKATNAQTGFAIASNALFLNEGRRTITLTINFTAPVPGLAAPSPYNLNCFTAFFTGKKKWEHAPRPVVSANTTGTKLIFVITLSPDDPAVAPYVEKLHAAQMALVQPVLKIYLDQNDAKGISYTALCSPELASIDIAVDVSGVRDLALSNDAGAIDAAKPFKPFGDFPDLHAGFYMGSKEIFQKQLVELDIEPQWKSPAGGPALNAVAGYLRQGDRWKDSFNMTISAGSANTVFSGSNGAFIPTAIDFGKNEKLAANTLEGVFRIQLNDRQYSLSQHLINISNALSSGTSIASNGQSAPTYTIKIAATPVPKEIVANTISVSYKAAARVSFAANAPLDNHLLLHLGPFGHARVGNAYIDASPEPESTARITLLQDMIHAGELFVGLANAAENAVVNILFQVADGSSNPLREMETLQWYYLATGNNWKQFKQVQIVDHTNNLTQSGIVTLTLPPGISNNNSLLDPGLHWIKVTAGPYADAVCKLLLVQAQAVRVQLQQDEAAGIEFRQFLPAGTISKLLVSDAAIKSIQQPFDSFDGRTRESDDHFYVRVSERLRHKQRAITIWDYEHIILEKFQKIFKVKCLNQSGFYLKNGAEVFCENYPGHVAVITLPNLQGNTNINPLRPYTPIGLLNNINAYLKTITSPFVKLHVKNPQFEEIQLDFKVKFHDHLEESFYLQLLNTEIEQFLCPWAYDNKVEISFGGIIHKSALLNFVEERPYVDYVTCFTMNHFIRRDESGTDVVTNVEEAVASTARSILVSYYDEKNNTRHKIVSPATCTC